MKRSKQELIENGFAILDTIYTTEEIDKILNEIEKADSDKETFRKSSDLFAIRQFLKEVPSVIKYIFNDKLKNVIRQLIGENYFVVKSIYFDKPENSNWYVAYHQDLTISVDKKVLLENYGPWTVKQNQFAVQPPVEILENITTIRIHLDETNEDNGALKVVPKSHLKKIYRPETIDWTVEKEEKCTVPKGGVMLMKPLLLHSSDRTTNHQKRRVIHIEFSNQALPDKIKWAEKYSVCQ
jgi:ectoine hydroxylase-related dioxygenase (phytanoyl-CoA dioxygenase family)